MIFLIIIVIIAIIIFALVQVSKSQAKQEVLSQGVLRTIFSRLIVALENYGFNFFNDNISVLEYHCNIDQFSFLKFTIRKTINIKEPYHIQIQKVKSGIINAQTIPWIILPYYSIEEFLDIIKRMINS